ncbi:hypothetical protein [Halocola ammonii]
MKKLINSGEVYYLKSANVIGSKNIQLLLRQESKYFLRNSRENEYDYVNFSLVIWMNNPKDAEYYFSEINKYFLDDTLSIDLVSVNSLEEFELELIGGTDYLIKVKNYSENILSQFKEDWVDRYLYATSRVFEEMETNTRYRDLIESLKRLAEYSKDKMATEVLERIEKFEKKN